MYDIITKYEVFQWLKAGFGNSHRHAMKNIQDAFIISQLRDFVGGKILEMGGGNSRVLERLALNQNECWNADKLEGQGAGPTEVKEQKNVILKQVFLGDYSAEVPTDYFDVVFSISVLEHVLDEHLNDAFRDIHRVLKPGGISIHAIDVYLGDSFNSRMNERIDLYRRAVELAGFEFVSTPVIDSSCSFQTHFASNSDLELYNWNSLVPGSMERIRALYQNVSIKMAVRKP
jgi:SAM-dependent methyltransferase